MSRPTTKVCEVNVVGPLAPFTAAFQAKLKDSGYTPYMTVVQLRRMAHLSRWLEAGHLGVGDLTSERLEQFLAAQRAGGYGRARTLKGLAPLVDMLRGSGLAPAPTHPTAVTATEVLLESFGVFLRTERGLAPDTVAACVGRARRFLEWSAPDGNVAGLTAGDVTRAVFRESELVSIGSVRNFAAGVRSFLRYAFVESLVATDLSPAALSITGRSPSPLPQAITARTAALLLSSCDRRRGIGRRDYAVILILLRLGLRAGEVARLTLDDLDWRGGLVVVHGKGQRAERLPIPADVGEAIAGYLQRGRPVTTRREVFLRALAPVDPLGRSAVSLIVRRAAARAGVPAIGAHRLRHTLATDMVNAGVALPQIAQVLRHRSLKSTTIYARVDLASLRRLARPWPGGELR